MKNQPHQQFAVVPPGLEALCARELAACGIAGPQAVHGGVEFVGGLRELYLANLWSRCASRILVRVGSCRSRDFPDLLHKTQRLPWGSFIRPGQRVQVRAGSRRSRLIHSDRVATTVGEAIRMALGQPDDDPALPAASVHAQLDNDECRFSIDSSGELLHRRGYRKQAVAAPLRENLAAGILLQLGWNGGTPLCDPCCGSGTFPVEAALLATNRPPGAGRSFAFEAWPGYRPGLWQALLHEAARAARPGTVRIYGSDLDSAALAAARANAEAAGVGELIHWQEADALTLPAPEAAGLLVTNPPYGERLGDKEGLGDWYRQLLTGLTERFGGWRLALLVPVGALAAGDLSGLSRQLLLRNGGLPVELLANGRDLEL